MCSCFQPFRNINFVNKSRNLLTVDAAKAGLVFTLAGYVAVTKSFLRDAVAASPHACLWTLDTALTLAITTALLDAPLCLFALLLALAFFLLTLLRNTRLAAC